MSDEINPLAGLPEANRLGDALGVLMHSGAPAPSSPATAAVANAAGVAPDFESSASFAIPGGATLAAALAAVNWRNRPSAPPASPSPAARRPSTSSASSSETSTAGLIEPVPIESLTLGELLGRVNWRNELREAPPLEEGENIFAVDNLLSDFNWD